MFPQSAAPLATLTVPLLGKVLLGCTLCCSPARLLQKTEGAQDDANKVYSQSDRQQMSSWGTGFSCLPVFTPLFGMLWEMLPPPTLLGWEEGLKLEVSVPELFLPFA